jgi:hypothetical protein
MGHTIARRDLLLAGGSVVLPVVVLVVYLTFAPSSTSVYVGYSAFGVAIITGIVCVWFGAARSSSRISWVVLYVAVMGVALFLLAVYFPCYVLGDCI